MITSRDRIVGCILGGAIGDAFGGPYEGQCPPIRIEPHTVLRVSDDTQLTLATCQAIVDSGHLEPGRIATEFAVWFRQRRLRGLGASTLKALQELAAGGHWAPVGRKGEMAAGNGAATRIAPLAFLLEPCDHASRQTIRDICRITHHHDEAYCGALAVLIAISLAYSGAWEGGTGMLCEVAAHLPNSAVRDRLNQLSSDFNHASLADVGRHRGATGYVIESVPLALAAAERVGALGFAEVIEQVIMIGGDTDSIAAMAGQICGTYLGHQGLPQDWLARITELEEIMLTAAGFAEYVRKCAIQKRVQ